MALTLIQHTHQFLAFLFSLINCNNKCEFLAVIKIYICILHCILVVYTNLCKILNDDLMTNATIYEMAVS